MRAALVLLLSLPGCSLLIDANSLAEGSARSGAGGAAGAAGASSAYAGDAGNAGSSNAGTNGSDSDPALCARSCDGLDAECNPTLDEPDCPKGCDGQVINGAAYLGCTGSARFSDAEVRCTEQGMHLMRIDSAAQNAIAVQLAQTLGSYVWIGGSDLGTLGSFTWPDGSEFFRDGQAVAGVYQNFDQGEPSAGSHCVQLHNDAAGPWSTAPCGDVKQFICKRY